MSTEPAQGSLQCSVGEILCGICQHQEWMHILSSEFNGAKDRLQGGDGMSSLFPNQSWGHQLCDTRAIQWQVPGPVLDCVGAGIRSLMDKQLPGSSERKFDQDQLHVLSVNAGSNAQCPVEDRLGSSANPGPLCLSHEKFPPGEGKAGKLAPAWLFL